jgi:hypothetical protein
MKYLARMAFHILKWNRHHKARCHNFTAWAERREAEGGSATSPE